MAGAAATHQSATATHKETSHQRAGRTRRTSADPQQAQQGATAAAAAAPAALDSLSRLQQLADASPKVAHLRRLQALANDRFAPVAQFAGGPEEEELVQGKFATAQPQSQLQQAPRANNTGLPDQLKSGIESLSGLSMDHVRVHYNSAKPEQLGAHAYAQGSEIHVAPGQEHHVPHEAWHVVQQKSGRVVPTAQFKGLGVHINADQALEQEADAMGDRAAALGGRLARPTDLRLATARTDTVQLAAPGGISHVTNSCFAAAIINIFTVTPSLKNLINPDAHADRRLLPETEVLRDLLFRAVNTVNVTDLVPEQWMHNIMLALAGVGAIANVEAADDVNNVLGAIIPLFQANDNAAGQANHNAAAGTCLWSDGQEIAAALAEGFLAAVPPNAVWFTRVQNANEVARAAPATFQHALPDGQTVTYRLTSVVQRNVDDYVDGRGRKAAHFVSYVDRSGAGNEWYQSDDIGPRVAAVPNLDAVASAAADGGRKPAAATSSESASATASLSPADRVPTSVTTAASGVSAPSILKPPTATDLLVRALASRRSAIAQDSNSEEDEASDDDVAPVTSSGGSSAKDGANGSTKDGAQNGAPAPSGGAVLGATGGLTYVYQRNGEAALGTHGDQRTNNAPGGAQGFMAEYALNIAKGQLSRLKVPDQRAAASQILRSLLFVPAVHEAVASDLEAFNLIYVDIKKPVYSTKYKFSQDPAIDKQKRKQRIHSVADQLHYLLVRLGAGPQGLANDKSFNRETGTELKTHITQTTAKEAQASTLAKLIAHYAGDEVRLPAYAHRCGPMLGRTKIYQENGMTMDQYYKGAADSLQAILSSHDLQGPSIRPTEAAAGLGAYISTDGDNFYGPHGFAFDPRDVHQLPLSIMSTDNLKKHSAERSSKDGHQFRATSVPIPFVVDGQSHVAEYFVGTSASEQKDLQTTLKPAEFKPGVLPITIESLMRDRLRHVLKLPPLPQVHTSTDHDQPKCAEEVTLMRDLIHELEGLYEPREWATLWQESSHHNIIASLQGVLTKIRVGASDGDKSTTTPSSTSDDEWE